MSRPEPYSACWTLPDHVDRAAALWPDHEALVLDGVRRTFEQFADATFEFARALVALGVEPGDRVGVHLPTGIPGFTALYGAARLGAVAVPLDPRLRSAQLRDIARHAGLKVLVAGADVKTPDAPTIEHVLRPGADINAHAARTPGAEVRRRQRAIAVADTALLMYAPPGDENVLRGARLGHEALVRSARILAEQRFPMEPSDRLFNPLGLASIGALQAFNGCLAVGSAYVGMKETDAAEAARLLRSERCTLALPGPDTLWAAIVEHAGELPDLWLVAVDGDPDILRATAERAPSVEQVAAYGSTEAGGLIAVGDIEDPLELRISSPGRPFPGLQVRILDLDTGEQLPAGQRGTVAVKGWSLFQGYHDEPGPPVDDEGFLHTGDVGSIDAEGRLFLGDVTFVR
jgi:fatty-acyl-CoA synthase